MVYFSLLLSLSSFYRPPGFPRMVCLFLITVMSSSKMSPLAPRTIVTDTPSPLSSHSSRGKKKKDLPTYTHSERNQHHKTHKKSQRVNMALKAGVSETNFTSQEQTKPTVLEKNTCVKRGGICSSRLGFLGARGRLCSVLLQGIRGRRSDTPNAHIPSLLPDRMNHNMLAVFRVVAFFTSTKPGRYIHTYIQTCTHTSGKYHLRKGAFLLSDTKINQGKDTQDCFAEYVLCVLIRPPRHHRKMTKCTSAQKCSGDDALST
jgi:hypothetical protein